MDDATRRVGGEGTHAKRRSRNAQMPRAEAHSPDTEQRTMEIREEIARTRDDMSETIDAIQDRLTPAHLVAQAGETVRNAATEKVKQMANSVGQAADQLFDSSLMETLRSNPIPAAMIGIGAAWLLMKGRSGLHTDRYSGGGYRSRYGRDWRNLDAGAGRSSGGYSMESGRSMGDDTEDSPQVTTFNRVMRDNPLALGAAAVIVGAVVGMSIPATETENELMGEVRDTVVERARTLASDAASKVSDAAGQVEDIASRAATAVGPNTARPQEG